MTRRPPRTDISAIAIKALTSVDDADLPLVFTAQSDGELRSGIQAQMASRRRDRVPRELSPPPEMDTPTKKEAWFSAIELAVDLALSAAQALPRLLGSSLDPHLKDAVAAHKLVPEAEQAVAEHESAVRTHKERAELRWLQLENVPELLRRRKVLRVALGCLVGLETACCVAIPPADMSRTRCAVLGIARPSRRSLHGLARCG